MMRHLTDEQIVEAAEGGLSSAGARHLATCGACASRVRDLQHTLMQIGEVHVPEPSPVFWRHFAANVNAAIHESAAARQSWWSPAILAWTAAAAVLVIGVAGFYMTRSTDDVSSAIAVVEPASQNGSAAIDSLPVTGADVDTDAAWAVVRSFAEDLHYDDAREAGMMPRPESVERAATELSEDERAELIRLIENDLKRTGA